MKQKRVEREEKEKQEQLQREKQRRIHGKEMTQVKQKYDPSCASYQFYYRGYMQQPGNVNEASI